MSTITSISSTDTSTQSQSSAARESLTGNFQDFLTLFVTQLQNQDPLSPMESSEFTNSLANLASVEQSVNTNSNLENIITLLSQNQIDNSLGYLEKVVAYSSSQVQLKDNIAAFEYSLDSSVENVQVNVYDSSGSLVYKFNSFNTAGSHPVIWDGKDTEGDAMEEGLYTMKVVATDSSGTKSEIPTTTSGRVDSVSIQNGETVLGIGETVITLDDIIGVISVEETTDTASAE